jgi:hypothetical protein
VDGSRRTRSIGTPDFHFSVAEEMEFMTNWPRNNSASNPVLNWISNRRWHITLELNSR